MKAVFNVCDDVYFHYYSIIEKWSMAITLREQWACLSFCNQSMGLQLHLVQISLLAKDKTTTSSTQIIGGILIYYYYLFFFRGGISTNPPHETGR